MGKFLCFPKLIFEKRMRNMFVVVTLFFFTTAALSPFPQNGFEAAAEKMVENDTSVSYGIEIVYPKKGYFYGFNTVGRYSPVLDVLQRSLVIDSTLKVGVKPLGEIEEVEFILTTNNFKNEVERKVDTTLQYGEFSCRFRSISRFFGSYEITAVAYHQNKEVDRVSVSNVVFLKLGSSGNKKPVAVIESPLTAWEGREVEFSSSGSYDPDGEIVSYQWDFGDGDTSTDMNPVHVYENPGVYTVSLTVTDDEGAAGSDSCSLQVLDYDLGVWVITKYDEMVDAEKLDIGAEEFIWMLHYGGGSRTYHLSMQHDNDTSVLIRFGKTQVGGVDAVMTEFQVDVAGDTDLSQEFEVAMEFRFPYSLLEKNQPPSEEYFSGRVGYRYNGDSNGKHGPHGVKALFYFGKKSFSDPGILRMYINPYYGYYDSMFPLTYYTGFLTVDEDGVEEFKRTLSVEFQPAAELTITSVPREGRISYDFGEVTAGETTTVSFISTGSLFPKVIQRFTLDPLPHDMRFDLTVLGERSFLYESSDSFDVTYVVDSKDSNNNIVKLALEDLPTRIEASWDLDINLGATASGFVDLNMSSNIGGVRLYLNGSEKPFVELLDFPSKFRVNGFVDVLDLRGYVSVSKYAGGETTVLIPMVFDRWEVNSILSIHDGSATASFDLPSQDSNHVSIGLDTDGDEILGFEFHVVDTTTDSETLCVSIDGLATDDLQISFDNVDGQVKNFCWFGKITKLINMFIYVNYQGLYFDVSGSWVLGEEASFSIEVNKAVEVSFDNLDLGGLLLNGGLSLEPDSSVEVEWKRGEKGYFVVDTTGVAAEVDITFGDKYTSEVYMHSNIVLNPDVYVKFDWEWGDVGHFYVYMPEPVGEYLEFEAGYGNPQDGVHQYGFKVTATDVLWITRQIHWDSEHGILTRVWVLGDKPIPGEWTLRLLWKYEWYNVPYP